jgi:hypothetical protein
MVDVCGGGQAVNQTSGRAFNTHLLSISGFLFLYHFLSTCGFPTPRLFQQLIYPTCPLQNINVHHSRRAQPRHSRKEKKRTGNGRERVGRQSQAVTFAASSVRCPMILLSCPCVGTPIPYVIPLRLITYATPTNRRRAPEAVFGLSKSRSIDAAFPKPSLLMFRGAATACAWPSLRSRPHLVPYPHI